MWPGKGVQAGGIHGTWLRNPLCSRTQVVFCRSRVKHSCPMGGASYGRDIQQGGSLTRVTRAVPHDLGLIIHNLSPSRLRKNSVRIGHMTTGRRLASKSHAQWHSSSWPFRETVTCTATHGQTKYT